MATKKPAKSPVRDNKANQAIVKKFKLGLRRVCALDLWAGVDRAVNAPTHEALANEFELARSDVTKGLDYGVLSLENLLILLGCLTWDYADLPPLPSEEHRCLGGYQEAIAALTVRQPTNAQKVDRATFLAVATFFADARYRRLLTEDKLTDQTWPSLVASIAPRIAQRLGFESPDDPRMPCHSVDEFQTLLRTWGKPVAQCLLAIPNRWTEWLELPT